MVQKAYGPDPLSMVGWMTPFMLYSPSGNDVVFILKYQHTDDIIIQHTYTPDKNKYVKIELKDVILPLLSFEVDDATEPYCQEKILQRFTAVYYEVGEESKKQEYSFSVIRAGVDKLADSAVNFLKNNFLTWQPQVKAVTYYSPEFLTYYAQENCVVMCELNTWNGTGYEQRKVGIANLGADAVWTIPVQYAIIAKLAGDVLPSFYDIWVETSSGERLTYVQRYYADSQKSEEEQWFLFENSLGGIDCFRAYGNSENTAEHTHNVAEIEEETEEYRVDTTRKFKKSTGFLDKNERQWLLDFFPSLGKYICNGSAIRKITVTESDVNYEAKELPSNFTFTYKYSDARPYLNLARAEKGSFREMNIHIPELGNFTIAPRLVECGRQSLSGGVLLPVQSPYSEEWGATTMDALMKYIASSLEKDYGSDGDVGHHHKNFDLLDTLSLVSGYLYAYDSKIKAGYADKAGELADDAKVLDQYLYKGADHQSQQVKGDVSFDKVIYFLLGLTAKTITAGDVTAETIAAGDVTAKTIAAGDVTAETIAAGDVTAETIAAGDVTAKTIAAGDVTAETIAAGDVTAKTITAGDVTADDMVTKRLEATVEAVVKLLHVKGDSNFDGDLGSPEFISGFLGGKGWRLTNRPITNAAGVQENQYNLELDNLIVRGTMRIFEMIVSQLLGENDNRIFTAMLEVDHYDPRSGKVYLDTKNGRMYNPFRKDDYVMVQQYNGMPTEENKHYVTKRYEMLITEVGSEGEGEKMLAWVKFRNFTCSVDGATPEQIITKRDTFVRVDNVSDPERKGIIQMMTVGSDTPYMDVIYGLKTDPNNALKGRLGNLRGIVHPLFGKLSGFGEYLNNLYAVGDFVLRRTGENIDTKFQVLENMFSSRFQKTSYELTNGENYLENGQFLEQVTDGDTPVISGWDIDGDDETEVWVDALGNPYIVNGTLTVSGDKKVTLEQVDGRQMLRLQNCGLRQKNALVKQPGTHREYVKPDGSKDDDGFAATDSGYADVQDTLYVNVKMYARTAGELTYGFDGCTAVDGKENTLQKTIGKVAYSGNWIDVKLAGKWNGTGDFVLRYSGDCYIALVSITDEPLSELSKTVSTQILQTASNIKLLGENIDKVNGSTTKLGIELDAEKKEIRSYVDTTDKKNREDTSSEIKQTSDSISSTVAANKKDADGKISDCNSKIDQTAKSISLKVAEAQTSADNAQASADGAQGTADAATKKVAELKVTVDGISSTVANKADTATLNSKVSALNTSITNAKNEAIKSANDRIAAGCGEYYEQATVPAFTFKASSTAERQRHSGAIWYCTSDKDGYKKGHTYRFYNLGWEDVTELSDTVSTVSQKAGSWNAAAGRFDSSGNLVQCSGMTVGAYFADLFAKKVTLDKNGNVTNINKSGLLVESDKTTLESKITDAAGKIVERAEISTMIEDGVAKAKIKARQIELSASQYMDFTAGTIVINSGNFTLDKNGNVSMTGKVTATSGKIGTLTINSDGSLTNGGMSISDDGMVFYNQTSDAGWGSYDYYFKVNIKSPYKPIMDIHGVDCPDGAVRISASNQTGGDMDAVALILEAASHLHTALKIEAGCVEGYRPSVDRISTNTAMSESRYPSGSTIICANTSAITVNLPRASSVATGCNYRFIRCGGNVTFKAESAIIRRVNNSTPVSSWLSSSVHEWVDCFFGGDYWYIQCSRDS